MKRCICLVLLVGITLAASGCSVPTTKNAQTPIPDKIETAKKDKEQTKQEDSVIKASDRSKEADNIERNSEKNNDGENKNSTLNASTSPAVVSDAALNNRSSEEVPITLYYQSAEGIIIPITRKFKKQDGIARASINGLVDTSINREELGYYGVYPVLPEETEIKGITVKNGLAVVDFNDKLLNYGSHLAERNIISSIVYTLTDFDSIKSVRLMINGRETGRLKYGTDISQPLSRKNILLNSDRVNIKTGYGKIDIYLVKYINDANMIIYPESSECKDIKEGEVPLRAVDLLVKKAQEGKQCSEIPKDTKLLESHVSGKTLILNFNAQIRNYGGTAREDAILKQLIYTMGQINGVKNIRILIDGKEGNLPEGTIISDGLTIPRAINSFVDEL